jgi:hypothetical protein
MTLEEVISNIQLSLTAWEGGIRATGGAIKPRKSHWYLIDFEWKEGKPITSYRTVQQTKVLSVSGTLKVTYVP